MGAESSGGVALMTLCRECEPFYGYEIVIDNASQVNVVHPRLLNDIKEGFSSTR